MWQTGVLVALVWGRPCSAQTPTPGSTPPEGFQPPTQLREEGMSSARDLPASAPGGKQDSLVTVDWSGPALAQVGETVDYALLIKNTSSLAVHKVQANVRLPAGMVAKSTKPEAATEGEVLVWQLGSLLPHQEKSLQLQLVISTKGEVSPAAWVSFSGLSSSTKHIRVHEPKLALKVTTPPRVVAGDPVTLVLAVCNSGDGMAGQVKLHADLPEGLEYTRGRNVDFEVGDLVPGESRTVQVVCLARAGGEQKWDIAAESGGVVKAQEKGVVNVLTPRLDVELTGPGLRYVDRKATYTARVSNRGDIPASNTTVSEVIPPGFKFVSASDGGRHIASNQSLSWFIGEIGPGQTREVSFELMAIKAGEQKHRVTACSERGFKVEVAQELATRIEDFSALTMEIANADDALEVGKFTTYEVIVNNAGSKMESDIRLVCVLPDKVEFKSAQGPSRYHFEGNVVLFDPVTKLAPRGDVVYQVKVKALAPGDLRFRAQVNSSNMVEPVIQVRAIRVYADRP
jgi:uncharacterized repeat protein (TIGR01451 family)